MKYKDYYKILGVSREAGQDEIKRAYRKLARKYHPDVNKDSNAEELFKEAGEAYEVLKDPEKKAAYDKFGADWQEGQDFQAPPNWKQDFSFQGGGHTDGDFSHFSDFFEDLFGRGHHAPGAGGRATHTSFSMKGEDLDARVEISLEDAYNGATVALSLVVPALDTDGRINQKKQQLNVNIPKGIIEGQRIRLAGKGGPGLGQGGNGDLFLEVVFRPHHLFRPVRRDIYLDLPVAPWEAALGKRIKVPTLGGKVDMKIPPNSQAGKKMRLKGRGLGRKNPGDQYVVLRIVNPPAVESPEAKAFFEKMEHEFPFNPRSGMGV
ncbi:MAG: DnaJ domain-containing protein [Desulfobulbaceae bacterium]|nr:DnaJ domain-containing protein [Desulfobulbaceae bacterium]